MCVFSGTDKSIAADEMKIPACSEVKIGLSSDSIDRVLKR